ncbi:MAG: PH domain-containing protein, partial [Gemmatimonadaceae bacterium]
AISSKRTIKRYDYAQYAIGEVSIETAGTIDLDIELKFTIGDKLFSIDVRKDYLEALKDIYKALHTIGKLQQRDEVARSHAISAASVLGSMLKLGSAVDPSAVVAHYQAVRGAMNSAGLDTHLRKDYSSIFEKYIHA